VTRGRALAAVAAVAAAALVAGLIFQLGAGGAVDPPPPPVARAETVTGVVRDLAGEPVQGARVTHRQSGRSARTDASGRYSLRLPAGARTLEAARSGYLPHVRATAASRADFELWQSGGEGSATDNSADRLIFWGNCDDVAGLSDPELDTWRSRGVDGFVCMAGRIAALGGEHRFDPRPDARLRGAAYSLQRRLRDARLGPRARERGMKLYLGFYAVSSRNDRTPFAEWFDDDEWARVLPEVRDLAGAARSLGFAGVALDQELYGAESATWSWSYPGNSRDEDEVRAQVKKRGAELMRALLAGFPGIDLTAYYTLLPGSWAERVQAEVNGNEDAYADSVQVDLWDGLTSVPGYTAIRWFDAIFYKTFHIEGTGWDVALQQNARAIYALASREFSGWRHASRRLHLSPFSWVARGPSEFERERPPAFVAEQLAEFRKWGTGREFANYAGTGGLAAFDYGPYLESLRAASEPGVVDSRPPTLTAPGPALEAGGEGLDLEGTAADDFAVRVVEWRDDVGQQGTARLTEEGEGATVRWSIEDLPVARGRTRVWLRVEDIKGLAATTALDVSR
jgi:hypothetical protein